MTLKNDTEVPLAQANEAFAGRWFVSAVDEWLFSNHDATDRKWFKRVNITGKPKQQK
jgi:hypothetical protein